MKTRISSSKIALTAVFLSLSIAIALAERFLLLELLIPVPGVKLGLANIVTLFALFYLGNTASVCIVVLRCILVAAFTSFSTLFFSLSGGLLAFFIMLTLKIIGKRTISLFGLSMAGAVAHNIGQIVVAALMLGEGILFTYLPFLMLIGLVTGFVTAALASPVFQLFEKVPSLQTKSKA